jgi:hypothetical protein
MKYEVIRSCVIKGSTHKVGDVVELDKELAENLMGIGRVVPHDESKLEDRSIGLNVETKPKRRAKVKKVEEAVEAEEE